jgi:hypothetical protein
VGIKALLQQPMRWCRRDPIGLREMAVKGIWSEDLARPNAFSVAKGTTDGRLRRAGAATTARENAPSIAQSRCDPGPEQCLLRRSYLVPMPSQWDRLAQVHTEFTRSGDLLVPCHEYCGLGHSEMWATVQVLPQDEFKPDRDGRVSCAQR